MLRLPSLSHHAALAALAIALGCLALHPAHAAPEAKATAPIKNFRLPTFTEEGHRHVMLVAGEARLPDPSRIELKEMMLTLFSGDASENIETLLAAPLATFLPAEKLASGPDTVRLERIDLTVTGADWTYDYAARKVLIKRDAHVIFRSALGDILK
jgi:hypothetical protein